MSCGPFRDTYARSSELLGDPTNRNSTPVFNFASCKTIQVQQTPCRAITLQTGTKYFILGNLGKSATVTFQGPFQTYMSPSLSKIPLPPLVFQRSTGTLLLLDADLCYLIGPASSQTHVDLTGA